MPLRFSSAMRVLALNLNPATLAEIKARFGPPWRITEADSGDLLGEMPSPLSRPEYDVVLVGWAKNNESANVSLIRACVRKRPDLPFVCLADSANREDAYSAFKAGAADFVTVLDHLPAIFANAVEDKETARLRARQRHLDSLGIFTSGIAHDLNNALGPLRLALDLLPNQKDEAKAKKLFDILWQSLNRATQMVRQLQVFAQGGEGEKYSVAIRDVLKDLETRLRAGWPASLSLAIEWASGLDRIEANPDQLLTAFEQLAENSWQTMPQGGRLEIRAESGTISGIISERSGLGEGPCLWIHFVDSGPGFPKEILDHPFEPFAVAKDRQPGKGLGLATAYGIVRNHGGWLDLENLPKGGAHVAICLPIQRVGTI